MTTPARPPFQRVRLREGYSIDEVDTFLDEVEPLLASGRPDASLTARLSSAKFSPVRLRPGYDMDQVDQHIDELRVLASQGHPRS